MPSFGVPSWHSGLRAILPPKRLQELCKELPKEEFRRQLYREAVVVPLLLNRKEGVFDEERVRAHVTHARHNLRPADSISEVFSYTDFDKEDRHWKQVTGKVTETLAANSEASPALEVAGGGQTPDAQGTGGATQGATKGATHLQQAAAARPAAGLRSGAELERTSRRWQTPAASQAATPRGAPRSHRPFAVAVSESQVAAAAPATSPVIATAGSGWSIQQEPQAGSAARGSCWSSMSTWPPVTPSSSQVGPAVMRDVPATPVLEAAETLDTASLLKKVLLRGPPPRERRCRLGAPGQAALPLAQPALKIWARGRGALSRSPTKQAVLVCHDGGMMVPAAPAAPRPASTPRFVAPASSTNERAPLALRRLGRPVARH